MVICMNYHKQTNKMSNTNGHYKYPANIYVMMLRSSVIIATKVFRR